VCESGVVRGVVQRRPWRIVVRCVWPRISELGERSGYGGEYGLPVVRTEPAAVKGAGAARVKGGSECTEKSGTRL
jgi:hypothetical protein